MKGNNAQAIFRNLRPLDFSEVGKTKKLCLKGKRIQKRLTKVRILFYKSIIGL